MASTPILLLIATTLLLIAATDASRPCKTILFITTTTTTSFPQIENPNFQNPRFLTLYFTNTHQINPNNFLSYKSNSFFTNRRSLNPPQLVNDSDSPIKNSIRNSTLDIVSIVGALLFGVGSGALTAAIMYLVWSMFSTRRFDFDVDSDDDDEEDVDFSPKKMGYVAVPVDNNGAKQVD